MSRELLELELRLLLARHGYDAVLETLGQVRSAKADELASDIAKLEERKRRKRKSKSVDALIADAQRNRPDAAATIQSLVARYEGKTFLPELRDVRRFLSRHGHTGRAPKSRTDALPKIIGRLCELTAEQLTEVLDEVGAAEGSSDYSLLTSEILGSSACREGERTSRS